MKKTILLSLSLVFLSGLEADTFTHKFVKGEMYRIVATVEEKVLQNDELIGQVSFLNKIAVEITEAAGDAGRVAALYEVSERDLSGEGGYQLAAEEWATFTIDSRGRYRVASSLFFPAVRDIPLFPAFDVTPGYGWTAPAEEIHDLRQAYGIRTPIKIPVNVNYKYLGEEKVDGRRLARFSIEYEYRFNVSGVPVPPRTVYPVKISGAHSMIYLWDIDAGKPDSYEEEFYALYDLSSGDWVEYMGTARGQMTVSPPLDKKETVEDINREIEKHELEGVRAEDAEQGVRIVLENIQFDPDSDAITSAEARKIAQIASILKKYPERDIKVVGHTAAVGTPESCLELSLRRAGAVGDALLERRVRRADQMTITGKGLTEPIATNDTEEGRIKNRRVEIFILEN